MGICATKQTNKLFPNELSGRLLGKEPETGEITKYASKKDAEVWGTEKSRKVRLTP
jgi:hypothetical protein